MEQINTTTPNLQVQPNQVVPNPKNHIPPVIHKPYFLFLFVFLIICITLFIIWASYRIYQIKKQREIPNSSPGAKIINTVKSPRPNFDAITNAEEVVFACSPQNSGECALYPIINIEELCPITFKTENCDNQCDNPANLCKQ